MAQEAITFFIMKLEECDYRTATGLLFLAPQLQSTLFTPMNGTNSSTRRRIGHQTTKRRGKKHDDKIDSSTALISFSDVPWPCDGDAQDMVVVMLAGEETPGSKISVLNKLLVFGIQIRFSPSFSRTYAKKIKIE